MVSDGICFEAFELSPRNESAITTKGRLQRSFPASAFSVSWRTFDEHGFQATLAQTVAKMSHQAAPDMQPKVRKARQQHNEDRDTTHPKLVTEHLMGFLRAAGTPVEVPAIWKNTREDVLWMNSLRPWRRSPLWLLVRVAMQLGFSRLAADSPDEFYKAFMVFFLAYILRLSHPYGLQSDTFYAMNAKISRRLLKLGAEQAKPWIDEVQRSMSMTHDLIKAKWRDLINYHSPTLDLLPLMSINPKNDTVTHLPELDDCIFAMVGRERNTGISSFEPTSVLPSYPPDDLPSGLGGFTEEYQTFDLAAFESWVESDLPTWLDLHVSDSTTCGRLRNIIECYYKSAASHYARNPEPSSIMLLTITELWIACDKSACILYGLLLDYALEIPVELLQSLVLPFRSQMKRLSNAERYLKTCRHSAKLDSPSIFRDFGHPSAFSVRYFNQSLEHQILFSRIEEQAFHAKEEKCRELSRKKEEYRNLMHRHDQSECDHYEVVDPFDGFRELCHSISRCKKCQYKEQAASINIEVNEWPLPNDQSEAKSTVFELVVPMAFGEWRDATTFFLNDVLGCDYSTQERPRATFTLQNYQGLSTFFIRTSPHAQRVGLLSQVKPHTSTHRHNKSIAVTAEVDVCLRNGLRYQYHDGSKDIFTSAFRVTERVLQLCNYRLPKRSSSLQKFLTRPPSAPSGPPPNSVIASQSDCPDHISLDEFKALCALPLGYRVQWMNILTQLAIPSVDFTEVEASIFLLQIIHQAGPPGEGHVRRASNEVLADQTFGRSLLVQLQNGLQKVNKNWKSSRALACFINLAASLLSFASSVNIQNECLKYLLSAREIAIGWVVVLRDKAQHSTDDAQRTEFLSRTVDVALVCVNTFHVDQEYLSGILASPSEASTLIQCSITIQEYLRATLGKSDPLLSIMLERWKDLSYRTFPMLAREVLEKGSICLDDAVEKSWSGYQNGGSWQSVASPHEHWLTSRTASHSDFGSLSVHFNLLTAELLVNGNPLVRLPPRYERHPTYGSLFGHSTLEVMPTRVPGMEYSAKSAYAGYTIHFGMQSTLGRLGVENQDLLLHAVTNGRKYDLLPSRIFRDKLPVAFVDKFAHWYDYAGNSVEFRPIKNPWFSSPTNWWLTKAGSSWHLGRNGVALLSVVSKSARTLSGILSGIEEPLHIHALFHKTSDSLDIDLPKLQLGFYLEPGSSLIHSQQFRGMSIDADQGIGTLIGLRNRIVLKHDNGNHDRLVVIPDGQVAYQRTSDHTEVRIDPSTAVKFHAYQIDTRLGQVLDNGNMQSKLFLCYLHGLTSYSLPDPLTRRTGTEQALSILSSAAVRSFDVLTEENLAILECIAKLAPGRAYHPANKRVMQTIDWDSNLSFLSQHGSFYTSVKAIFEQANDMKVFYSDSYIEPPLLDFVIQHLQERDLIRTSTFRVYGFGAEKHAAKDDVEYASRDRGQNSERATRTFVTASLIFQRRPVLHAGIRSGFRDSLWESLKCCGTIDGRDLTLQNNLLKFDSKWLEEPSKLLGSWWCRAHLSFGRSPQQYDKFLVMMWLSTVAFAENADMQFIHTLAAFYNGPDIARITAPPFDRFELSSGAGVDTSSLRQLIRSTRHGFSSCPEARLPKLAWESEQSAQQRRQRVFQSNQDTAINGFATQLECQWPCEVPQTPVGDTFNTYLNTGQAMGEVRLKFKAWFQNHRFYEYLGRIADELRHQTVDPVPSPSYTFIVPKSSVRNKCHHISIGDLFAAPAPSIIPEARASLSTLVGTESGEAQTIPRLDALLAGLDAQARTKCETDYIIYLRDSLLSLRGRAKKSLLESRGCDITQVVERYRADCNKHVQSLYSAMKEQLVGKGQVARTMAAMICQWPRVSPALFLEQLTHERWTTLTDLWKECVLEYGLALTDLQRADRLVDLSGDLVSFTKELINIGHQNWSPSEFPETLLLEVESGILIRGVQEDIARQMRTPPCNENAVMQLNMGEGKSSVIVPIVAAALADGKRLVRVVVAKPQSKQMFQMLVSKLGGLLGRRICRMPFSRALRLEESQADAIGRIHRDCMANRGILLVQPEHILSFKLMGVECLATGHESVGRSLLQTQHFFDTESRDIIDESDENFSVKFELVYTMGMQRPIEFGPERWTIIQAVLGLIRRFALGVKRELPLSIEVDDRWPGRFPRTRILRPDAHELILQRVGDHICRIGFPGFPIARQPEDVRLAVFKYITKFRLTAEEVVEVESEGDGSFWTDSTRNPLLLIRGLIAGGVLSFAFGSKRWRVNYGLDPNRLPRTRLSVPFQAKDSPTPRSEFSHPDVVIILTSLCYYYGGLDDDDLFTSFGHLLKSDQAQIEYGEWVCTAPDLPDAFRQLAGVNIKDRSQCIEQVFPSLRYSKGAVDYFLSHIVFPKEMKEFPHKISASGWDIGQTKNYPTSGFSGTNDSRHTLPLSVQHLDLPEQKHTNALVLEYLLRDENSVELLPSGDESTGSDAELLLAVVTKMKPAVRVILDVGAQILELSNVQVAGNWLHMWTDNDQTKAVVFFDDNDELSVLDRGGQIELLQTSPFAKQLDVCLVFLDEVHTRGTDLKLPNDYRAAVTLGPNLTKDRLVQGKYRFMTIFSSADIFIACMRMRKLGQGQSVVFCIPREIKTKISERTSKRDGLRVEVADVLSWAISETLVDLRRSMPLWATQGRRFENQKLLWAAARSKNGLNLSKVQASSFLEEEAQTLKHRYHPHAASKMPYLSNQDGNNENVSRIIDRCVEFESLNFNSASLQEEQERELSPEIEQERQVERPEPAKPETHHIHRDVKIFVRTGELVAHSQAFLPAFEALRYSSAAAHLDVSQFPHDLLVTADFARTVKTTGRSYVSDAYQRPVQWILTSAGDRPPNTVKHMVISSPFEAQELLALINECRRVTLHIYTPRPSLVYRPLDALDLFTVGKPFDPRSVPRQLVVQLNLFAGQLYLSSFEEYTELCDFLGLAWRAPEQGVLVRADGFIVPDHEKRGFRDSPVKFLKVLMMKIRRNCEEIEKTHVGKMLHGGLLEETDFEF